MNLRKSLNFAFWISFAFFIWWVADYLLGFQTIANQELHFYSTVISSFLIPAIGLSFFFNRRLKETEKQSWGDLFLSGGILITSVALLNALLSLIFYGLVNPSYTEAMANQMAENAVKAGDDREFSILQEAARAAYSPGALATMEFSRTVICGIFLLLILCTIFTFLQRKHD